MLRDVREAAGSPTYRVLGRTSGYSAATLSKAAAGQNLPRLEVALAFVRACGGDRTQMRLCWIDAYAEMRAVAPPEPDQVTTVPEFATALESLMRLSGFQSQHTMANVAKKHSIRLSRSTLCRMLSGRRLPSAATLKAFLQACAVPGREMRPWHAARRRLAADLPSHQTAIATGTRADPGAAGDTVADSDSAVDTLVNSHTATRMTADSGATAGMPADSGATADMLTKSRAAMGVLPSSREAAALYDELCALRRGPGLWTVPLPVGPILGELSRIGPHDSPQLVRVKVTALLSAAAEGLPAHLAPVAAAGFAFDTASAGQFLENRLTEVAAHMGRDRRTARRRLNDAQRLMAARLLRGYAPAAPREGH